MTVNDRWIDLVSAVIHQLHSRNSSGPSNRYILLDNARIHWQHGTLRAAWVNQEAPYKDWAFIDLRHVFMAELVSKAQQIAKRTPDERLLFVTTILQAMELSCCPSSQSSQCGA